MDFLTLEMDLSLIEKTYKVFGLIRFKCMFKKIHLINLFFSKSTRINFHDFLKKSKVRHFELSTGNLFLNLSINSNPDIKVYYLHLAKIIFVHPKCIIVIGALYKSNIAKTIFYFSLLLPI
jgi:hypothetical protein